MNVEMKFALRDKVRIDGSDLMGWITAIIFRVGPTEYEVSYTFNGTALAPYI